MTKLTLIRSLGSSSPIFISVLEALFSLAVLIMLSEYYILHSSVFKAVIRTSHTGQARVPEACADHLGFSQG